MKILCIKTLEQTHLSNMRYKTRLIEHVFLNVSASANSRFCLVHTIVKIRMMKCN